MATSPNDPNPTPDPLIAELQSLKQEIVSLRYDLRMPTTFKISNEINKGVSAAIVPWLSLIFLYLFGLFLSNFMSEFFSQQLN